MANLSPYSSPLGTVPGLNTSKSLFHDFVRPRGQFSSKLTSSPFKGSPQPEVIDFIPLGYSSPISNNNNNYRGQHGNQWRGNNRRSFGHSSNSSMNSSYSPHNMNSSYSPYNKNSSMNSSYSPYNKNRNHFHKNSSNSSFGSSGNNSFVNPGHSDDINLYYHPSMLQDPWAELEQKLQTRMAEQNYSLGCKPKDTIDKSVSNLSSVDSILSLTDSDEGADSQEIDSTVLVSDGSS
ncbi:hypothetical protein L9F63_016107 [Diploptera punctata]|uniref:Uncharacterized protein n=1 Tax=Diploptera punctata TaxID=6984 RepID=A0AAD8EHV0_DIPPU|nr:hypothetical protein L9F63_016107 [Diploptera punctata]